jgi:LmbE family N-acetylglucosaminyl deacetylase
MKVWKLFFAFLISVSAIWGQQPGDILHRMKRLGVVGSAMYIAAHPDDENTRLIAWLANVKGLETTYLSLTRGDGGQNLIGTELGTDLGLIRSKELEAARAADNGYQLFSRAVDFGFSKSYQESYQIWNRDSVLNDLIRLMQAWQPDVIFTRFTIKPGGTHGHHTASARLALRAFEKLQQESTNNANVFRPERIFWNTSWWFFRRNPDAMPDTFITVEVGEKLPLLGTSIPQIAAKARSLHRSQGFGSAPNFTDTKEYFQLLAGSPITDNNLFENLNFTWARFTGNNQLSIRIDSMVLSFSPENPSASIPALIAIREDILKINHPFYSMQKERACRELIKDCSGLYTRVLADKRHYSPGDSMQVESLCFLESGSSVEIVNRRLLLPTGKEIPFAGSRMKIKLPQDLPVSQPYWLERNISDGLFDVSNPEWFGLPANPPAFKILYDLKVGDKLIPLAEDVQHREVDPAYGEKFRPVFIFPRVLLYPETASRTMKTGQVFTLNLKVEANDSKGSKLSVSATLPRNWQVLRAPAETTITSNNFVHVFSWTVKTPDIGEESVDVRFSASLGANTFNQTLSRMEYPHTGPLVQFPTAISRLSYRDYSFPEGDLAYLEGAGDRVADQLQGAGLSLRRYSQEQFLQNPPQSGCLVIGIRALNVSEQPYVLKDSILAFASRGGRVIMQYHTTASLPPGELLPGLSLGRERVTEEHTVPRLLKPAHALFTTPHKLDATLFSGWTQEIGLYAAQSWTPEWTPLIWAADSDEAGTEGLLLIRSYGKGSLVYTGLSFFRQLPAAHPGAMALFLNILSGNS